MAKQNQEKTKIEYILNELRSIELRVEQINQYRRKIKYLMEGHSIQETEEKYKPIDSASLHKLKEQRKKVWENVYNKSKNEK